MMTITLNVRRFVFVATLIACAAVSITVYAAFSSNSGSSVAVFFPEPSFPSGGGNVAVFFPEPSFPSGGGNVAVFFPEPSFPSGGGNVAVFFPEPPFNGIVGTIRSANA